MILFSGNSPGTFAPCKSSVFTIPVLHISNNSFCVKRILSIKNGNTESEEEYYNNSRAKKIKVTVNNDKEYIFELEDTNKPQLFDMNVIQNDMSTPMIIDIEVQETYKGLKSDDIYITEIGFGYESGGLGAR